MLILVGFVIGAAIVPAIVVPAGAIAITASAFGFRRLGMRRVARAARRAARVSRPTIAFALVAAVLGLTLVLPVAAGFIAQEPSEGVGIARLRVYPEGETGDPDVDDSYFLGEDPDPWVTDSWIITVSGNVASFGINVTNRHSYIAYDVSLRVPVNDISLLTSITLTVTEGETPGATDTFVPADFTFGTPTLSNGASWPSHGIYDAHFVSFFIGDIGIFMTPTDTTVVAVVVEGQFTEGLKVHFDADGWTMLDATRSSVIVSEDTHDTNIRNPNSADTTVQIPSVTSIVVPAGAMVVLYAIVIRRRKKSA